MAGRPAASPMAPERGDRRLAAERLVVIGRDARQRGDRCCAGVGGPLAERPRRGLDDHGARRRREQRTRSTLGGRRPARRRAAGRRRRRRAAPASRSASVSVPIAVPARPARSPGRRAAVAGQGVLALPSRRLCDRRGPPADGRRRPLLCVVGVTAGSLGGLGQLPVPAGAARRGPEETKRHGPNAATDPLRSRSRCCSRCRCSRFGFMPADGRRRRWPSPVLQVSDVPVITTTTRGADDDRSPRSQLPRARRRRRPPKNDYAPEPIVADRRDGDPQDRAVARRSSTASPCATSTTGRATGRAPRCPGEVGNAVFPGHRTTHTKPFRNIDQLVPGDR